jgi:antitoxin Phd
MRTNKIRNRSSKRLDREPNGVQKDWQLQEAKARFSEVFRLARECGPQRVTKHGRSAVVVLPAEEYERLSRAKTRQGSLARFFADSPLAGSGIQLDRPRDLGRTIDL